MYKSSPYNSDEVLGQLIPSTWKGLDYQAWSKVIICPHCGGTGLKPTFKGVNASSTMKHTKCFACSGAKNLVIRESFSYFSDYSDMPSRLLYQIRGEGVIPEFVGFNEKAYRNMMANLRSSGYTSAEIGETVADRFRDMNISYRRMMEGLASEGIIDKTRLPSSWAGLPMDDTSWIPNIDRSPANLHLLGSTSYNTLPENIAFRPTADQISNRIHEQQESVKAARFGKKPFIKDPRNRLALLASLAAIPFIVTTAATERRRQAQKAAEIPEEGTEQVYSESFYWRHGKPISVSPWLPHESWDTRSGHHRM